MLVIDNEGTRKLVSHILQEEGFEVLYARGGWPSIETIAEAAPSLVILDSSLAEADCNDLCRALRRRSQLRDLAVMMIGSEANYRQRLIGLQAGADDFIASPFDFTELVMRARNLVGCRKSHGLCQQQATGLPISSATLAKIENRLSDPSNWAVLYVELNNLRTYNHRYGSSCGDQVIDTLEGIVGESVAHHGEPEDVVAYLGSEDFTVTTTVAHAEAIASEIITAFDRALPDVYPAGDYQRATESARSVARERSVPLLTVSIGIATRGDTQRDSLVDIIAEAKEVRGLTKGRLGSAYVFVNNRRVLGVGRDL